MTMTEILWEREPSKRRAECSFCGNSYHAVGPLVEGPDRGRGPVYICRKCVEVVMEIFEIEARRRPDRLTETASAPDTGPQSSAEP
jgi:hypothetical protein